MLLRARSPLTLLARRRHVAAPNHKAERACASHRRQFLVLENRQAAAHFVLVIEIQTCDREPFPASADLRDHVAPRIDDHALAVRLPRGCFPACAGAKMKISFSMARARSKTFQ